LTERCCHYRRVLRQLDLTVPYPRPSSEATRLVVTAYLPAGDHASALDHGLLEPTVRREHVDYRREMQRALERASTRGVPILVTPIDVAGLLSFAEREGLDPARRDTRLAYTRSLARSGRGMSWPPERNAPCWCGSGRKYKKCCGCPGFSSVELPSPAILILRVELAEVDPPVWRRVAAPSHMTLAAFHALICEAMGWDGGHGYAFDDDGNTYHDPGCGIAEHDPSEERLLALASEVGYTFSYTYDLGDEWTHTVTLEDVREAGPTDVAKVIDGVGACPPEDCGGPRRYMELVRALRDPSRPDHDDAVERLGRYYNPSAYQPALFA
jgi:hypothetical protein